MDKQEITLLVTFSCFVASLITIYFTTTACLYFAIKVNYGQLAFPFSWNFFTSVCL